MGSVTRFSDAEQAAAWANDSGYGKDMSLYALEDYTVPRHVMVKL